MAGIAFRSVVDTVQERLALQANLELGRGMLKDMTIKLFNSKPTHTVTHRKARDNNGLTWVSRERMVLVESQRCVGPASTQVTLEQYQ
jgi:hypothetical protein